MHAGNLHAANLAELCCSCFLIVVIESKTNPARERSPPFLISHSNLDCLSLNSHQCVLSFFPLFMIPRIHARAALPCAPLLVSEGGHGSTQGQGPWPAESSETMDDYAVSWMVSVGGKECVEPT